MLIDGTITLLLLWAVIKGWQKGLIVAVFSVLAFIIGLAAALKLSVVVAHKIGNDGNKWMPFITFFLIFILTALIINISAKFIQSSLEWVMLGWINKIGGIVFFTILYAFLISLFLFYGISLGIIKDETVQSSTIAVLLQPWGPAIIDKLAIVMPIFKNMFQQLTLFFAGVADKI
ncbi:MAG: CvpA family protein [Ferruginibacter sp.]|nr:CvpA family protein [Ferruginibacter sp.]